MEFSSLRSENPTLQQHEFAFDPLTNVNVEFSIFSDSHSHVLLRGSDDVRLPVVVFSDSDSSAATLQQPNQNDQSNSNSNIIGLQSFPDREIWLNSHNLIGENNFTLQQQSNVMTYALMPVLIPSICPVVKCVNQENQVVKSIDNKESRKKFYNARRVVKKEAKVFTCDICRKSFNRNSSLKIHSRIHKKEPLFQCMLCGHISAQKITIERHVGTHKIFPDVNCASLNEISDGNWTIINNKCKHTKLLINNVEKIDSDIVVKCLFCKTGFQCKKCLNQHMNTVHADCKKFACPVPQCKLLFPDVYAILEHIASVHNEELLFRCKVCPEKFSTLLQIRFHIMQMHKNYYTRKNDANEANPKLTKLRKKSGVFHDLKCQKCAKVYKTRDALKRHHLSNHGNFPWKKYHCLQCSNMFSHNFTLQIHMKTKHKNKNKDSLACEICSKSFQRKDSLQRHKKNQHSNEISLFYQCHKEECNKKFKLKESLLEHLKNHDNPILCSQCGKPFVRARYLKLHLEKSHKK